MKLLKTLKSENTEPCVHRGNKGSSDPLGHVFINQSIYNLVLYVFLFKDLNVVDSLTLNLQPTLTPVITLQPSCV